MIGLFGECLRGLAFMTLLTVCGGFVAMAYRRRFVALVAPISGINVARMANAILGDKTAVPAGEKGRNLDIDFLRGLSILWVVALHASTFGVPDLGWSGPVFQNGYYGVIIFFVISGYLITSTSLVRYHSLGRLSLVTFYSMRVARIIPCLLLLIALLLSLHFFGVAGFTFEPDRNPFEPALYALIFRYNYYYWMFAATADLPWRPLWSLGIEEWFYVAFPIICIALRRRAFIAAAAVALIIHGPFARENQTLLFYWSGCADSLAVGCLTALFMSAIPRWPNRWIGDATKILGMCIIIGCCFLGNVTENFRFGPSIVAGGAALFVFGARAGSRGNLLDLLTAPIRLFGERSYEIYLFHVTIIILVLPVLQSGLGASSHLILPGVVFSIFISGVLIGRLFADRWNRQIRKLFIPKRATEIREATLAGDQD
jgi:peptidoglycan/LPS O-acetylase OafA/YrhL